MSDAEAETAFRKFRWRNRWRAGLPPLRLALRPMNAAARTARLGSVARACNKDFTITAGTLFASPQAAPARLPGRHRDLLQRSEGQERAGPQPRSGPVLQVAFVLLHKLREAMAEEMKGRTVGGEGKVAEIDGGYFGGYVKPANQLENRRSALAATRTASARLSSSSASVTAILFRPYSIRKAKPRHSLRAHRQGNVVNADEAVMGQPA